MTRTIAEHGLLEEGDHVLVAVSGGKDSCTLLDLLWRARRRAPCAFELTALHLDQGQPGYDGTRLRAWLEQLGAPFEILHRDIYSVVERVAGPNETYCAPCSRMRRGVLYGAAERLACNKIALGHHLNDALETLLLNLFYAGRLQAMPAAYTTDDGRFVVIRPLLECAEADLSKHAEQQGYPGLRCTACAPQDGRREAMARLISRLEAESPTVRQSMLAAIKNVQPTHLLDPRIARTADQGTPARSRARER